MERIVGGMFGLPIISEEGEEPPFIEKRSILLANGRSGIYLLKESLSPPKIWLPSYLCDVVLSAVEGTETRFYEVAYDLSIPSTKWIDSIGSGDLVILINYFGFPCDKKLFSRIKKRGAWVLQDASQALLSEQMDQGADYVLFSPRKFLGVPDGGILRINADIEWERPVLFSPPSNWWLKAIKATILRREFDHYGGKRTWFHLFRKTESTGPIGPYAMSDLSIMLLKHSFDYTKIIQQRINNYKLLSGKLASWALFPSLPKGVVPLGFPICLQERDRVREILFKHQIYPPIHWAIEGIVPKAFKDSHRLAAEIMTLPCDQRYNEQDMERMANLIQREVDL
jgi:dTDP-4-amino-4,6-dideoxygalactose transaminase